MGSGTHCAVRGSHNPWRRLDEWLIVFDQDLHTCRKERQIKWILHIFILFSNETLQLKDTKRKYDSVCKTSVDVILCTAEHVIAVSLSPFTYPLVLTCHVSTCINMSRLLLYVTCHLSSCINMSPILLYVTCHISSCINMSHWLNSDNIPDLLFLYFKKFTFPCHTCLDNTSQGVTVYFTFFQAYNISNISSA